MVSATIRVIKSIFTYSKRQAIRFLIGSLFAALISPFVLYLTQNVINTALAVLKQVQAKSEFFFWIAALVLAEFLVQFLKYRNACSAQELKMELYRDFSDRLLEKYMSMDFACFESGRARDIMQHVGNAPQELLLQYFTTALSLGSSSLSAIGYTVIFFSLSPAFGMLGIGCLVLLLFLNYKGVAMMAKLYDEQTSDERRLAYYDELVSTRDSLLDLKINHAVDYVNGKRSSLARTVLKERLKGTLKSQVAYGLGSMSMVLWLGLVVTFVVSQAMHGTLTYGVVVALIGAAQSIYACFEQLAADFAALSKSRVNITYLDEFLALPETEQIREAGVTVSETRQTCEGNTRMPDTVTITFEHVSFRYPDTEVDVLKDVSFSITPNQKVALVGANGSGKTTIIKLLCGLYRPTSGRITLNGVDIGLLPPEILSRIYSVVFQDFAAYQFTIRENVAIGHMERAARDEEIRAALRQGMLEGLFLELDTPVGNIEEGINLSGGQWQKLALARACFKKGMLLILDEPTAAMDPGAENELYQDFLRLMEHNTCILVSHRLAVARQCDHIIVIRDGRVVQRGSHDRLMAQGGLYHDMFQAQSQWYA